jgi:hypothetical protein
MGEYVYISWCATYVVTQNCSKEAIAKTEEFMFGGFCENKNFNYGDAACVILVVTWGYTEW